MRRYHMERSDREITEKEEVMEILRNGTYCTIALSMNDEPYVLTLSYGLDEENSKLYFHTAPKGKKLDFIEANERACGTVIEDLGYRSGECSHVYKSVVFYGAIKEVTDIMEKEKGMMTMFRHLEKDPDAIKERFLSKDAEYDQIKVLRFDIEEIQGKEKKK
ncbi:MAG: pyridoxamine 5'-phosphate oxidase family protein [Candidatus Thermoplasmatota archaeon]|nr:pyridoxamine 5'-phosphate oxidase family protein [Candidatus Thermoplasmatota archaeon]